MVERSGSSCATTTSLEAGGRAARFPGGPKLGAVLHPWQHAHSSLELLRSRRHGRAELAVSCPCRALRVGRGRWGGWPCAQPWLAPVLFAEHSRRVWRSSRSTNAAVASPRGSLPARPHVASC